MIDEVKLADLRRLDAMDQDTAVDEAREELFDTIEKLWKVARAAHAFGHTYLKRGRTPDKVLDKTLWDMAAALEAVGLNDDPS